jgi:hypothetical protein
MPMTVPAVHRRALALAAVAVLLTRLPWIANGYGSDPDSYRVAISARQLWRSGQYEASRLPGYPLYEYLTALSAAGPPWISNAVTALFSVAAFLLFALMLRELGIRRHLLLAFGFAMVPVIYLNSCCTIDYIPSLAFMLAASYAVLRGRPLVGGLLLGLAVGCRITAGALALPLCLWMLWTYELQRAIRTCLQFGVTLLLASALCYLPVYRVYGLGFFTFFDNDGYPPADVVLARAGPLVWGQIGALTLLAVLCLLPLYYRDARESLRRSQTRRAAGMALVAIALFLTAYLRLPDEAGYLIPVVPWVLLLIGLLTPPRLAATLSVALLLSPWIAFDAVHPSLNGPMVEDHRVRQSQHEATDAVIRTVATLPARAVVVAGWVLPRITLQLDGDQIGDHRFVYLIEGEADYRRYLADGWQIYYLPGVDLYESQAHQLELSELGARQLQVPFERQRPASTGE